MVPYGTLPRGKKWPKTKVKAKVKNNIIKSYNHFILMRTHRWPYGPCFMTSTQAQAER